ncbi:hypothetical protein F2P81_003931 [Scophthalmus maximus]|uniref:GAG-pre-integrase domain-containing protein n=1 Tax=Scophthalmus maximus TaxID=52904 RepID=A0A6A4TFJ0_SCOMX|nr:hypothetical protein F2P81_003931 [Scophthalmus maximus]
MEPGSTIRPTSPKNMAYETCYFSCGRGVRRNEAHIVDLRGCEAIRHVQGACKESHRWKSKPAVPKMADLPAARLRLFKPAFHSTGIDSFGPFQVKVGQRSGKRKKLDNLTLQFDQQALINEEQKRVNVNDNSSGATTSGGASAMTSQFRGNVQDNSSASVAASLWHQHLGHTTKLKELVNGVDFSAEKEVPFCEECMEGKLAKKPYKSIGGIRSKRKMPLIHSHSCTGQRL